MLGGHSRLSTSDSGGGYLGQREDAEHTLSAAMPLLAARPPPSRMEYTQQWNFFVLHDHSAPFLM